MNLVLDTNALWNRELLEALRSIRGTARARTIPLELTLPAIAYTERMRQIRDDEDRRASFQALLDRLDPKIEPFGTAEAERTALRVPSTEAWHEHGRDFLIAAHVHSDRIAVTQDQGPAWEGIARLEPNQAAQALEALVG